MAKVVSEMNEDAFLAETKKELFGIMHQYFRTMYVDNDLEWCKQNMDHFVARMSECSKKYEESYYRYRKIYRESSKFKKLPKNPIQE